VTAYTARVERLQRLIEIADDATILREGYSELEVAFARLERRTRDQVELIVERSKA
jgi:hypothetical protein